MNGACVTDGLAVCSDLREMLTPSLRVACRCPSYSTVATSGTNVRYRVDVKAWCSSMAVPTDVVSELVPVRG